MDKYQGWVLLARMLILATPHFFFWFCRIRIGAMEEPWSFTLEARRSQKRARFNLLALEHDEYYFQVRVHRSGERNDSIFFVNPGYVDYITTLV